MFEVGSTVLYGSDGVCTILDIAHKEVGGVSGDYYVLEPVYQKKSTVFVPLANQRLVARMRDILSADELHRLIKEAPSGTALWIKEESERKITYKEIISRGDCAELMQLVRGLYRHRDEQETRGKRLHASDDRFLKTAEKMIKDEFAVVLGIDPGQVASYIADRIPGKFA